MSIMPRIRRAIAYGARALNWLLPVGPRSVLFGAHCWFLHPIFVAVAWRRLYGTPLDPRLWLSFFLHDLGYLAFWCRDMDGEQGERHVLFGAAIMRKLFGPEWGDLCLYHSRFWAKKHGRNYSRLCVADKLATALEPAWLYIPRVWLSRELVEYMAMAGGKGDSKYKGEPNSPYVLEQLAKGTVRGWHAGMTGYLREWVAVHADGKTDTWTPGGVSAEAPITSAEKAIAAISLEFEQPVSIECMPMSLVSPEDMNRVGQPDLSDLRCQSDYSYDGARN